MAVQMACGLFLSWDMATSLLGIQTAPIAWVWYELVQLGAVVGLILGTAVSAMLLVRSVRGRREAERSLRLASGAFMEVLAERFDDWALTPAERDVALFAIKGLSTAEIAALRSTSEGTVKAQTAAIYRKAGVSGRPQLLSLFIDELMGDGLALPTETPPQSSSEDLAAQASRTESGTISSAR
ncbi:helix-turn-helix transcriptional regulator [Aestuariicoccus sp. KMU-90]|uniref:Helix-turn-helix transcriptional regulator n=2 Tax=Thetidibacter halocola TaxID=2827239 RepID=A0A8J7WEL0_9RHOB|nr:LuxR C-terminal-related transcriptional regulator [Thetidibacter halocola]MBS0126170.1 helix-turn-helix transcriptional regulator [Thetidibacter halocola]